MNRFTCHVDSTYISHRHFSLCRLVSVPVPPLRVHSGTARRGMNSTKRAGPVLLLSLHGLEHNLKVPTACPGRLFGQYAPSRESWMIFGKTQSGIPAPSRAAFRFSARNAVPFSGLPPRRMNRFTRHVDSTIFPPVIFSLRRLVSVLSPLLRVHSCSAADSIFLITGCRANVVN